jgi:hypothetical protein
LHMGRGNTPTARPKRAPWRGLYHHTRPPARSQQAQRSVHCPRHLLAESRTSVRSSALPSSWSAGAPSQHVGRFHPHAHQSPASPAAVIL